MKIASFSIADYSEATEGMPHDVERLYFRMLLKMYSRESGLPDNDDDNARILGYRDVRTYKALKAKLLKWPDAIRIEDGLITNGRVESDLSAYREKKRLAAEHGKIGGRSAKDQPKIDGRSETEPQSIPHTTNNKNNDIAIATPTPSPTPVAAKQQQDSRALYDRLITAANGALDNPVNCQGLLNIAVPQMWLDSGADLDRDVIPTLEAAGKRYCGKRIRDWSYFTGMVAETRAKRERGLPVSAADDRPVQDAGAAAIARLKAKYANQSESVQ